MTARPQSEAIPPVPHDEAAEGAVLGTILLQHLIPETVNGLKAAHFFDDRNQRIFRCMQKMDAMQVGIDEITLLDHLGKDAGLVGGVAYVSSLTDGRQAVSNVEFYAQIVQQKALLRSLMRCGEVIQREVANGDNASAIVERARKSFAEIELANSGTALRAYTPAELAGLVTEPIEYVAYPLALRGMIGVLDGPPKSAGKTTLILHAVRSVTRGELFLNRATRKGNVLLVSEENRRTLIPALDRVGLSEETAGIYIMPRETWAGIPWAVLVKRLEHTCVALEIKWLIIDTFFAVAGLGADKENNAGDVDEAVAPLRDIAGKLDIAITLTRHDRKSGGEIGQSGRGSIALTGACDVVLQLKRLGANYSPEMRQLGITGRLGAEVLAIELSLGRYISHEHADVRISTAEEVDRLSEAITSHPKATIRELEEATGIKKDRITKLAAKSGWTKPKKPKGAPWTKS